MKAAQARANDMGSTNNFSHSIATTTDMTTPWAFMSKAGYNYSHAGENLAEGFDDSTGTMQAWQKSPDHNGNLISPDYSETGVGLATGTYQGKPTTYVIQFLGSPQPTSTATSTPAAPTSTAPSLPYKSLIPLTRAPVVRPTPVLSKNPAPIPPAAPVSTPPPQPSFSLPTNLSTFANANSTLPQFGGSPTNLKLQ